MIFITLHDVTMALTDITLGFIRDEEGDKEIVLDISGIELPELHEDISNDELVKIKREREVTHYSFGIEYEENYAASLQQFIQKIKEDEDSSTWLLAIAPKGAGECNFLSQINYYGKNATVPLSKKFQETLEEGIQLTRRQQLHKFTKVVVEPASKTLQ